jgi:HK97 gp10 family phage protein
MQFKRVKGMDDFLKDVEKMKSLPDKEVKKVSDKGAGIILATAKQLAPNMTIKNALGFIRKKDAQYPRTALIGIMATAPGTETFTAPALAAVFEFGTAERHKRSGASTGAILPRPFFRPAIDQNRDKVKAIIKNGLLEIIKKQSKNNKLIK